jgi:hypothetical protein
MHIISAISGYDALKLNEGRRFSAAARNQGSASGPLLEMFYSGELVSSIPPL